MGAAAFLVGFPLACVFLDGRAALTTRSGLVTAVFFGELTTVAVGGYWLYHAANGFFGKTPLTSLLFTGVVTLTHAGLFIGFGVFTASRLTRLPAALRILGFASSWTAWELARSKLLYGCPWDLLGHAFSRSPALMQLTAVGGVYALSFLAAAAGSALGIGWMAWRRGENGWRWMLAGILVPAAAWAGGTLALPREKPSVPAASLATDATSSTDTLRVAIVQTAIGKRELWEEGLRAVHLDRFDRLSRRTAGKGVDLVVWAENAVPFVLDAHPEVVERLQNLSDELGAAVLLGAPRSENRGDGKGRLYNSIYFFRPGERDYTAYDKTRLLPYIESIPEFARSFFSRSIGIEYTEGSSQQMLELDGWRIAPLICFESTYPELATEYAARGADLLVNVSNDAWFDRGAAAEQHFAMSVFRAPEIRRPLVRVANGGVSAAIDPFGRILASPAPRSDAVEIVDIQRPLQVRTWYSLTGDTFAWACVLLTAALLVAARWEPAYPR